MSVDILAQITHCPKLQNGDIPPNQPGPASGFFVSVNRPDVDARARYRRWFATGAECHL